MRKVSLIIMSIAAIVLVTSCIIYSFMDENEKNAAIGDVVKLNDWNITVNSMSFEKTIDEYKSVNNTASEGNIFLVLDITIKNIGTKKASFLPWFSFNKSNAKIIFDDTYEISPTILYYDKDLHNKTLNPLSESNGILVFEVAQEIENSDKPLVTSITDNSVKIDIKLR